MEYLMIDGERWNCTKMQEHIETGSKEYWFTNGRQSIGCRVAPAQLAMMSERELRQQLIDRIKNDPDYKAPHA